MAKSQRGMGIMLSYVSVVIGLFTSLVFYTPLINKTLGMEEYGVYSWALSIIQYLSLFQLGLYSTFTRFYSRLKAKNNNKGIAELNGLFLCLYTIIGIVAFIAGMFVIKSVGSFIPLPSNIKPNDIGHLRFLMLMMVVNICIDFPTYIFLSNIIVREQYVFARVMHIAKQLLNPLLGIPMLLLGVGSSSLVFATTAATLVNGIMSIWFCMKKLHIKFRFKWPKFAFLKEIFTFSFFIFINLIVNQINWGVDKNILGILANTIQVGIYTNADQLSQYFFSFASSISDVYMPMVHRIVAANKPDANKELTKLFIQVGRLQFMLLSLIMIGFIAVGKPFVMYYAKGYLEVYYVAIVLFSASMISAIQCLGIPILEAKNMHQFKAILNFTVVILNIAISIPLCIYFGAMGAALGTFVSNIFINGFVINWYYAKKVGLNIGRFWRSILQICRGLIFPVLMMAAIVFGAKPMTIPSMIIWGIVIVITFVVSMLKWGMNKSEREMVIGKLTQIIHR